MSAPALSAAFASLTVVTVASHLIPLLFIRATNRSGNKPMMDEMIAGPASNNASHCASKLGGVTSAASAGTSGPQSLRKRRTAASAAGLRLGGGSGIQRLI